MAVGESNRLREALQRQRPPVRVTALRCDWRKEAFNPAMIGILEKWKLSRGQSTPYLGKHIQPSWVLAEVQTTAGVPLPPG